MQTTMWLGLLMAAIAIVNSGLMAWLWRFPMKPDPTGRDPNGISSAPRFPTNLHRVLGYVFVMAYLAILVEMVPRMWEFRAATVSSVVHAGLGVLVGFLLVIKIAIIRRFRRFGHRLPWIGGTLAVTTVAVAGLGVIPAWIVTQPLVSLSPQLAQGREVVARKCTQCHGASTIAAEREDAREWNEITRKMQRFSRTIPGKDPILDDERMLAVAYLSSILAEVEDERDSNEEDDPRERDRRGRRGRGRR